MRYLYTALFYLLLPFLFLRLLWRSRRLPDYRHRWLERLGFCPHRLTQSIWVHAVSVGETLATIPLIKALRVSYPEIPIVVTNMTPTGSARAKAALGDSVFHAYVPYDVPDALARFIRRIHPLILIIMETEIWPNLFAMSHRHHIPIVLANARLSPKSAKGYQRFAALTREMLSAVHALASQGHADAERFIALGMPKDRVVVTGNIKFDLETPLHLFEQSAALRADLGTARLIWIAASTHSGEDGIILTAHSILQKTFPNALLILVPRHPERFNEVANLCEQKGFLLARRSLQQTCQQTTAIYLGDTMGELLLLYAVSDVAFVGGSFVPVGGHNMLEPAMLGKPIITGPQLFNFAEISQMLLAAKGMLKVADATALALAVSQFFSDQSLQKQAGEQAKSVVEKNRGALKKQLDIIRDCFFSAKNVK